MNERERRKTVCFSNKHFTKRGVKVFCDEFLVFIITFFFTHRLLKNDEYYYFMSITTTTLKYIVGIVFIQKNLLEFE